MITFGIPLKGKMNSNDWNVTEKLFLRTLISVTSQTNENWRVLVACEDIPVVPNDLKNDPRVEFILLPHIFPIKPMDDKGRKINAIGCRLRELGGGYLMLVDADDLVSNRIAELCSTANCNGFVSTTGYLYFENSSYLRLLSDPWRVCGSCVIVKWQTDDLPNHFVYNIQDLDIVRKQYIINMSHVQIPQIMKLNGRELLDAPFPTTIYCYGHGENISVRTASSIKKILKHCAQMIRPMKRINKQLAEEFSITDL